MEETRIVRLLQPRCDRQLGHLHSVPKVVATFCYILAEGLRNAVECSLQEELVASSILRQIWIFLR
ncbi:hypothetical protein KC19_1G036300 [Ceratodon purpureus]|uniref:Uncharacterized protein n=1 Tax=Ceratodon purpureus TaxID=3225 RepID=A0A8T0J3P8_CERPU|nr:hypothetical protein KC19_1G036300 [Ceratodon purpureus]